MPIEGGIRHNPTRENEAAHIMIVAPAGTLYQSLAHALQEHLGGCQALICEAGATIAGCDGDVRLVLIHANCATGIASEIDAQRALYPSAAVAILIDDADMLTRHCYELFEARKVQGILPMTLKLEVWMVAVLLLLSGGEYYPVMERRQPEPAAASPPAPVQRPAAAGRAAVPHPQAAPASPVPPPSPQLPALTAREREILALLSEGHQNKLIAHKMSLSEHTVKVHVHNLLSKLRVSNRTQAAATYRRGLATMPPPGAGAAAEHAAPGH